MAENDSDETTETGEGEGSEGTPGTNPSTGTDELALARKRQAGAEAARQVAESKAKGYEAELAKYRAAAQTEAEKDLGELARQTARAEAAEKRASEAEEKANGRILDARFPKARAKLPTITDEATLAEIETMFGETDPVTGIPTPLKHNEKSPGGGAGEKKELTVEQIKAQLLSMPSPF